jgi:type IV secretory pathway VirB9-like protein
MLLGVGGLIFNFYSEWKADEAAEEIEYHQDKAIMFDSPEQKEEHKDHIKEAPSALEQHLKAERDKDFQKEVLKQLQHLSHIDTLNADQMFQIKDELRQLKNQR